MASKPDFSTLPTLRQLSWKTFSRDRAQLLAVYPRPVLLLPRLTEPAPGELDQTSEFGLPGFTTARGFKTTTHDDEAPAKSPLAIAARAALRSGEAIVCPLEKSGRNSFAEMVTVGRANNNDVVIPAETVSKLHGYFMQGPDGKWRFSDTGSMNGVWLRGTRVPARATVDLSPGDEILLGPDVPAVFETAAGLFERLEKLRGASP